MGAACGGGPKLSPEQQDALKRSKEIDKELGKAKRELNKEVKMLLLGTGASGKSTIAKQMQIIYLNGFGDKEKEEYKALIAANIVQNIQALIRGAEKLEIPLEEKHAEIVRRVLALDPDMDEHAEENGIEWDGDLSEAITALWNSRPIQQAFARSNEFQLSDSAEYFFKNLNRYGDMKDFAVLEEDILRVRKRTTGVIETDFTINDMKFRMVDVGGQRNERRKWIHCFQGVTAIIYVASLSEYDQVLEEDQSTPRMQESLHLFEEIVNNEWFDATPIILFLNKNDLFIEKIAVKDITEYVEDYDGGKDEDSARKWIKNAYLKKNHSPKQKREVYTHVTTATDTKNILTVFDAVQDIFLGEALNRVF